MKGEQGSARAAWGGMHEKPSVLTQGDEEHLTLVVDIYSCIVIQECHSLDYLAMTVGGNTSFSLSLHKHSSDSCCRCLSCDFPSVPTLVLIPEWVVLIDVNKNFVEYCVHQVLFRVHFSSMFKIVGFLIFIVVIRGRRKGEAKKMMIIIMAMMMMMICYFKNWNPLLRLRVLVM